MICQLRNKFWRIAIFILLFIAYISVANAAQKNGPPPSMPLFNEVTIRQMLNSIDQGYNFTLLRAGYFGGHRKSSFPVTDGFAVLKSTLETQRPGDLKWFLLEALRGSAAFHAQELPLDDGFDAYGLIFDNINLATTSQTQAAVHTSIRDFVTSIDTSLKRKGGQYDSRTADLLVKAWNVWHKLPPSAIDAKRPLDWSRAVKAADAQDKFTAIVGDALKDTTHAPDFQMLKLAVVVLEDQEPQRAIDLLKTAQKKMEPGDLNQQKWLYETWTKLITGNDPSDQLAPKITDKTQLAALVEMRKDQISYTGHGYADLLKLYWQLNQNDKAAELMKVISQSGVRAAEKIDVAKVLLTPPRDLEFDKDAAKQMQARGVELLQTYLSSTDKRNPDEEIRARYELGRYFVKQDQITQALQALDTGDAKPASRNSQTAFYYQQILQMKAALEKKLSDIPGAR